MKFLSVVSMFIYVVSFEVIGNEPCANAPVECIAVYGVRPDGWETMSISAYAQWAEMQRKAMHLYVFGGGSSSKGATEKERRRQCRFKAAKDRQQCLNVASEEYSTLMLACAVAAIGSDAAARACEVGMNHDYELNKNKCEAEFSISTDYCE